MNDFDKSQVFQLNYYLRAQNQQSNIRTTVTWRYFNINRLTLSRKILGWNNVFLYQEPAIKSLSKNLVFW